MEEDDPLRHTPYTRRTVTTAASWLAFMLGALVGGEIEDPASFAVAGVIGAVLVSVGVAAAARCRPLPQRVDTDRARLAVLSLVAGIALGLANLLANWLIAAAHPTVRALLVERMVTLDPVVGLIASPLMEEISVRLFLMSVIAWLVLRLTKRMTLAFAIALLGSALVFALLHLGRPFPGDPALANYYRTTLVIKYTLAGLPLGWIFWRWGLPYAILCHIAANAAHLVAQGVVF